MSISSNVKPDFNFPALKSALPAELASLTAQLESLTTLDTPEAALEQLLRLESLENHFSIQWGILGHLNATHQTPEIRQFYNEQLAPLSHYRTLHGQSQALYQNLLLIRESTLYPALSAARQRAIELALLEFRLSGIGLPEAGQKRYAEITARLSSLASSYSDHLIDATKHYTRELAEDELAGLPSSARAQLEASAKRLEKTRPTATLDAPVYMALQTYADSRALREELYHAYTTRASSFANLPENDNAPLMEEILRLRLELAQLLGFENYGAYSLATKMAPSTDTVKAFLQDLAEQALPAARKDFDQLQQQASLQGLDEIRPWDVAWLSEKVKQRTLAVNQEELRAYFPVGRVLDGLFNIITTLFGVSLHHLAGLDPDEVTQYLEVRDSNQNVLGHLLLDLYARPDKRAGAWVSGFQSRLTRADGTTQLPAAFVVCNFTPPTATTPALLTHQEIVTLFHEFGHALHHVLTRVDVPGVSGIHGVEWDAVELPSQMMEFWTWEPDSLARLSGHVTGDAPLPLSLLESLVKAKVFQSGLQTLRQVEFALFDMNIHTLPAAPDEAHIHQIISDLRKQYSFVHTPEYNRFQNAFSHIFAGGYAAGYYSYKWAEVLAADAFDRFEHEGVFNPVTGLAFKQEVLEKGGSRPALDSFRQFRGRDPQPAALARHSGFATEEAASA